MKTILRKLKINKQTSIAIYAVLVLLMLVGGISYAAIRTINEASDNMISSGQISMTYTEPSNTVILKDALPQTDDEGVVQTEYFEFSVISDAKTNENDDKGVELPYEISISKVAVDAALKQLNDSEVKVYLTELNGESETPITDPILISELATSDFDSKSYKLHSDVNKHSNNSGSITKKYRLRFWIDYQTDASSWDENNKYEYKFKVNINASAGTSAGANPNALATKVKGVYSTESGLAKEENGYYYLTGVEKASSGSPGDSPSETIMAMLSTTAGINFYRTGSTTIPADQISKIINNSNNTLGYQTKAKAVYLNNVTISTYNQEQLEKDMRYYQLNINEIEEDQYNALTEPFGGYINVLLGAVSGVIDMENMAFAEGYTIDDIPTLDQVMANEEQKSVFMEMIYSELENVITSTPDGFDAMYRNGNIYNKDLLTENLNIAITDLGMEAMIEYVSGVFGDMTNYLIAEASGLVEYNDDGMPGLAAGKTQADIPTLESIFLGGDAASTTLLTNTYIKLNGILWEILGINKDNTIKLISTTKFSSSTSEEYLKNQFAQYFGYNEYAKNAPFLTFIKGTTLEDLIVKTNYQYEENGVKKTVKAYASLPTYEDIANTMKDGRSYLNTAHISVAKIVETETNGIYHYNFYDNGSGTFQETTSVTVEAYPVITIKNIEVSGDGSKNNPYIVENEVVAEDKQTAKSISDALLNTSFGINNLGFYENTDYNFEWGLSSTSYYDDKVYTAGVSLRNKCYYNSLDGTSSEVDYSNNCRDKFPTIGFYDANNEKYTYSYNETKLSITATNATSYQWQQKIGNEWVDLEDLTGRISGSKTNELTIIPTNYFAAKNYFRCVVRNEITKTSSKQAVVNIVLTDGEWVYEEIGDTNKYQIVSYIGDHTNSAYFTLLEDDTNYQVEFPTVINGDTITTIQSLKKATVVGTETWSRAGLVLTSIEIPTGIIAFNADTSRTTSMASPQLTFINNIIFNEGLVSIGNETISSYGPFRFAKISELKLPNSLKTIENNAFREVPITELELPSGLETIGDYAFGEVKLTSLKLNEKVKEIGIGAFYSAKLTKLEIPSSVRTIKEDAFKGSSIKSLVINNGIKTIDRNAFLNAVLTDLTLPTSLEVIGDYAFKNSRLTSLTLNEGLKTIGYSAFSTSPLTELIIPNTVETIGASAFNEATLTNLEIPASVKTIGSTAFARSPLTTLTLHEGLETIGSNTFQLANLTSLNLPSSVEKIEYNAFYTSRFTDLKIYGKTSLNDFQSLGSDALTMASGYEPQFVAGTLD